MGKRLDKNTLAKEYGQEKLTEFTYGGRYLLQEDYGEDYDCTLTSLAAIFGEEHYELIESYAEGYGYDGKKRGTSPFQVEAIMQRVLDTLGMKYAAKSGYVKGIGFTWRSVDRLLRSGHKLVLNIHRDGRDYYKNHSVLIVGTAQYGAHRLLAVYDNWNAGVSYVDYDKLCRIASINWYE